MNAILLAMACTRGGAVPVELPESGTTTIPTPPGTVFPTFDGAVPRNLVMISLDTMRRDHAGAYDDGPSLTPFLDARMAEGFALDDLTSCSNWTVASTACVLAGANNLDRAEARGMIPILVGSPLEPIPRADDPNGPTPLLPQWLRELGYQSLLVTANGYFSRSWGNAQGYDQLLYPGPLPIKLLWGTAQDEMATTPLVEPWFLHLHSFEPHGPYLADEAFNVGIDELPPIPFDLSTIEGQEAALAAVVADPPVLSPTTLAAVQDHFRLLYAGEVRRYDAGLTEVWTELDAAGFLDDALVVFWTDHGEGFWEQGIAEHAKLLHRNENDAIAFFWAKNIVPGRWAGPTEQRDITPTILTLFDAPIPAETTGTPVGLAPDDRVRFALSDAYKGPVQSVRSGDLHMQFRWEAPPVGSNLSLFELSTDPEEQTTLFDPSAPSEEALAMWALLLPEIRKAEPWIAADPRGYTPVWPPGLPTTPE